MLGLQSLSSIAEKMGVFIRCLRKNALFLFVFSFIFSLFFFFCSEKV